jgi:hypothetical protein
MAFTDMSLKFIQSRVNFFTVLIGTGMVADHGSLEEHIKSKHYSVKGYTCSKPGCDEDFTSERDLKFHLLLHNDSDMCTFECEICDYRCHQQHVLDWHMKNLHPETVFRQEHTPSMELDQNN